MIKEKLGSTDNLVKKYNIDTPINNMSDQLRNFDIDDNVVSKIDEVKGIDTTNFFANLNQNFENSRNLYKTAEKLVNDIQELYSKLEGKVNSLGSVLSSISNVQKNIENVNEMFKEENSSETEVKFSELYDILKTSVYKWGEFCRDRGKGVASIIIPHIEKHLSSSDDMRSVRCFQLKFPDAQIKKKPHSKTGQGDKETEDRLSNGPWNHAGT